MARFGFAVEFLIGDGSTYHFWMVVLAVLLTFAGVLWLVDKKGFSQRIYLPMAGYAGFIRSSIRVRHSVFEQGTQKTVMPGVYDVNLESTGYGAFNLWCWPSKGIHEIADQAHIAIFDSEGKLVQPLQ